MIVLSSSALHVPSPGIQRARLQIIQITLVGIGFTLKGDIAVGIAPHGKSHKPFDEISEEKKHKEHLTLLSRVDALVVHHLVAQVHSRMHKKYPQQVDCRESIKGQYRCTHNLHRDKGTIIFGNRQFPADGCHGQERLRTISASRERSGYRFLIKKTRKSHILLQQRLA